MSHGLSSLLHFLVAKPVACPAFLALVALVVGTAAEGPLPSHLPERHKKALGYALGLATAPFLYLALPLWLGGFMAPAAVLSLLGTLRPFILLALTACVLASQAIAVFTFLAIGEEARAVFGHNLTIAVAALAGSVAVGALHFTWLGTDWRSPAWAFALMASAAWFSTVWFGRLLHGDGETAGDGARVGS